MIAAFLNKKTLNTLTLLQSINLTITYKNNLQNLIKQVINQHKSLKITNQDEANFVVISAEDWDNKKP